MNSLEFIQKVKNKEIDVVEHTKKVIEECKKLNKEYNYFNVISEDLAIQQAKQIKKEPKGKLAGLPVSVKDCICVKDVESRAGSKILSGYKPVFDADVIERIKKEGAIIIGKTAQDEFGFGSFSANIGLGMKTPLNPFDKQRSCGGSSGGSAGITQKASFPHIAIAESTGGSIECPASFCGVTGLCPTYGRVSRYGLIDYANSLDKIGAMAKTIEEQALMLNVLSGYDKRDSTSINKPSEDYKLSLTKPLKGLKIGIIKESLGQGVDNTIKENIMKSIQSLEKQGAKTEKTSLLLTSKYSLPTYYIIALSEASTNLAKYSGMRYGANEKLEGNFNQYFSKVRSANFTKETKRRIIIGTFARMAGFRDAYYIKATKIRTQIIQEYKKAFKKYDCLITPTMPITAPKFKDLEKLTPLQNYMMDTMTVGPNLAGLPHISINIGSKDKMPIGMMLTTNHLEEGKLLQIASKLTQ